MSDSRTKCGRCGKRIRVMVGTKKRRCVQCDFDDQLVLMRVRDKRDWQRCAPAEQPTEAG